MKEMITLDHGSGGTMMQTLISDLFYSQFSNEYLNKQDDSAILPIDYSADKTNKLAFTTDAFVINPLFFPGGDIGKLSICGTVNDLIVSGAKPLYLSSAFIIEEGFLVSDLKKIVESMAREAKKANIKIVAGDTKVVRKGDADGMFITTSGVGTVMKKLGVNQINLDDAVIVSGTLAEHGFAVMANREGLNLESPIKSDCAVLNPMLEELISKVDGIKFMRDPTRGGLAAVLNEIVSDQNFGIEVDEPSLPISDSVLAISELLGIDIWNTASEGRAIIVVKKEDCENAIKVLRKYEVGKDACYIGSVTNENVGKVVAKVSGGGKRVVAMPSGEGLPRIC